MILPDKRLLKGKSFWFQTCKIFTVNRSVALELLFKLKWFWIFCLTFQENGLNFFKQIKSTKKLNILFSNAKNFRFWCYSRFKTILKENFHRRILSSTVLKALRCSRKKHYNLHHSKSYKEIKHCCFWMRRIFVLSLRAASKKFPEKLLYTEFQFKNAWRLCITLPENRSKFACHKFTIKQNIFLSTVITFLLSIWVA